MKIPQSILESIQISLEQEAKRICRDAAKILRVPEKNILEILKKMPKTSLIPIDDSDIPYSCPVLEAKTITERCRRPCLLGTGRCHAHQSVRIIPEPTTQKTLTRIQATAMYPDPLWCDESDGTVYTADGEQVGSYSNQRLTIYTTEKN
jgi:hypothetical protein